MDEPVQRGLNLDDEADVGSSITRQAIFPVLSSSSRMALTFLTDNAASSLLVLIWTTLKESVALLVRLAPQLYQPSQPTPQPASPLEPAGPPASPSQQKPSKPTNQKIWDLLHNPVNISNTKDKSGFVYVLPFLHNGRTIVKIGHTTARTVAVRATGITRKCGLTIQPQPRRVAHPDQGTAVPHQSIETLYKLVESLAHAELGDCAYNFTCACGTNHQEFFAVDEEFAFEVVGRWIRFCEEQEPWVFDATTVELKAEWRDLLGSYRKALLGPCSQVTAGGGGGGGGDGDELILKTRAAHWQHVLGPTNWDRLWCDVWDWSAALWNHGMATLVVLLCAVVVCMGWNSDGSIVIYIRQAAFLLGFGMVLYRAPEFRSVTAKRLLERWAAKEKSLAPSLSASPEGSSPSGMLSVLARVLRWTRMLLPWHKRMKAE